jgi:hypothetical protein
MASQALTKFRAWLETSKPGADYVYHIGDRDRNVAIFTAAREAEENGDVALFQRASDPPTYHARRLSVKSALFLDRLSKAANPKEAFSHD